MNQWICSPILWVVFLFCWCFPLLWKNFLVCCSPIYFFFCFPCLGRYIQENVVKEQCLRFCCLCLLLGHMVSRLAFKSFIHFQFILLCGIGRWSSFIFLHVSVQFSQHHLMNKLSLAHCMCLLPLSNINWL